MEPSRELRQEDDAANIALIRQLGQQGHQLCTCSVVECEVFTGLPAEQRRQAEQLLDALDYLQSSHSAARQAGD